MIMKFIASDRLSLDRSAPQGFLLLCEMLEYLRIDSWQGAYLYRLNVKCKSLGDPKVCWR